jgi:hypothetical protein
VPGGTLGTMITRIGTHRPLAEQVTPARDAVWMLVDLLASIIGSADDEVATHVAAMHASGSVDGQCQIVADMACSEHPHALETLDLLARYHPDAAVAREARKCAMRLRTHALAPR